MGKSNTALTVASTGLPKTQRQAVEMTGGLLTYAQIVWLSFRRNSLDDKGATDAYNEWVGNPEKAITDQDVEKWWGRESFKEMAAAVVATPSTMAFLSLSDTLLPMAFRALYRMLESNDSRGVGKAIELLLRAKGMLIDTVRHDNTDDVAKVLDKLRHMEEVGLQSVYRVTPPVTITEGEYTVGEPSSRG